jgi:hypothetical protein
MFRDKIKVVGMVALTLAILVGALSLNATSVVFAADQSAKPASSVTPSDARLRVCNVDGDHDSDDLCRVISGRYFFGNGLVMGNGLYLGNGGYGLGNGYAMRNRYLVQNFDTDNDVVFPINLGPYPKNSPWWWWR